MNEKNDQFDDDDNDDDNDDISDDDDDVNDDNDNCDDENEYGRSPSNGLSSGLNQKLRCCVNTLSVGYMRNRRKRRLLEHTLDVSMNCNSFSALSDDSVMIMEVMMILSSHHTHGAD